MTRLLTSTLAVLAFTAGVTGQTNTTPAVPLEPITAILDAFRTHDIVALGEGRHNNEQGYQFRLALIRDPRFAATVNDIVVESGSSTHQNVMDRFIRGESVPDKVLRLAWQDTTVPDGPWDIPMYEEFFKAVRAVNASLPADRKLRVLLGDPPFDWEHATREEAIRITVQRDPFAAELIQREVLARKRRALVIYGDGHLMRRPTLGGSSLVTRLEGMQARVLNIWTHTSGADLQTLQPDLNTWPTPALAFTRGTTVGAAPFSVFRGVGASDGTGIEDEFDAVLSVGPSSSITIRRSEIAPSLCEDAEYMRMRLSRMALIEGANAPPPGIESPSERLKRYCAGVGAQLR
ncbi:MAG TPA: hypothetical protein VGF24_29555 [Vicinamibacterales bacterium]|jgi:hypothetical protein